MDWEALSDAFLFTIFSMLIISIVVIIGALFILIIINSFNTISGKIGLGAVILFFGIWVYTYYRIRRGY